MPRLSLMNGAPTAGPATSTRHPSLFQPHHGHTSTYPPGCTRVAGPTDLLRPDALPWV